MNSSSRLTLQETVDLLHKLMTDSVIVQAAFLVPGSRVTVHVRGLVVFHEDKVEIGGGEDVDSASLRFELDSVTGATYGDRRAFSGTEHEGLFPTFRFSSALSIYFHDSVLILFEVAD
jgi:hypothetical protein